MPNEKGYPVHWLRLALRDIEESADYIAQDDIEAAKRVVERIWKSGQSLATMPAKGRPGRVAGTRELVLPGIPFFIAYRVKQKRIQILRVIHTARDWPSRKQGGLS
jgi:plasmid stabilization system protein ParE